MGDDDGDLTKEEIRRLKRAKRKARKNGEDESDEDEELRQKEEQKKLEEEEAEKARKKLLEESNSLEAQKSRAYSDYLSSIYANLMKQGEGRGSHEDGERDDIVVEQGYIPWRQRYPEDEELADEIDSAHPKVETKAEKTGRRKKKKEKDADDKIMKDQDIWSYDLTRILLYRYLLFKNFQGFNHL